MAEPRRIGVALLAAGSSRRFGDSDKLAAPFRGTMLGNYTSSALPTGLCARAWVIASRQGHPCQAQWRASGFDIAINPGASEGMGTSVALAARLAAHEGLDALLIALADMPLVPVEHYAALIDAVRAPGDIATSATTATRLPPACFGSDHLSALAATTGETGARHLLDLGEVVPCPPEWLVDIDTPEALERIE